MEVYIANHIREKYPKNKMLLLIAKFYRIGKLEQYELFKDFDNSKISYQHLGDNFMHKVLLKCKLEPNQTLNTLRIANLYQGRTHLLPCAGIMPKIAVQITEKITELDKSLFGEEKVNGDYQEYISPMLD